MKQTKPALTLLALLGAIYMTPTAFAGATNTGDNTSATPGTNSSTTVTPTSPEPTDAVDPGTPATRANGTPSSGTGATAHDRSDTTKSGEMKSKSMKNCDTTRDPNCEKSRVEQMR